MLFFIIYLVGLGVNWLWEEGKTNTMAGIICENYFCSYNFSGKIWEYSNVAGLQYFDTKQECKKYCVKDTKEELKEELTKTRETGKVFFDPPEYKKAWYYKIENFNKSEK